MLLGLLLACAGLPTAPLSDSASVGDSAAVEDSRPPAPTDEICDGLDNDEDGFIDEGLDLDGDGFTPCEGDCDEAEPTIRPSATEECDGLDNDCSGAIDEPWDEDGDGDSPCGSDCDDADPANSGHLPEVCDGVDNNCDGAVDEGFDQDGDGYSTCRGDCDDSSAATFPGATEVCDGLRNDCVGDPVDEAADLDGDGLSLCEGDCDDGSATSLPGGTEVCDGHDNDCNGAVDESGDCYGCTVVDPYILCTTALSWTDAQLACRAMGIDLTSIADGTENATVAALTSGYDAWIGYNDLSSEGSWAWSNGAALGYTNWNGGEPNDSGGEDCTEMYNGGGWNDLPCTATLPFICER